MGCVYGAGFAVLCLPIIEWDHRYQRPQHLCAQFASDGHPVYYAGLTFNGRLAGWSLQPLVPNIKKVVLPGPADHNRFLQPLPDQVVAQCCDALEAMIESEGLDAGIILVQQPFWAQMALRLASQVGWKVVYDCMDEHDGLTVLNPVILQDEARLAAAADLVITTSHRLAAKHEGRARRHLLLPNAGEYDYFSAVPQGKRPLSDKKKPVIGYYGAIMDWFDVDMVTEAAVLRPDWDFVLIGAVDNAEAAARMALPNVHLLGEKPYRELADYLYDFDVALIPFRRVPIIEATNPVKFYEYLGAGKPVVATPIPELMPFSDLFYAAQNGAELVAQVERAMAEDSAERRRERQEWAAGQTWESRYRELRAQIEGLWQKVSIVIVSYQSLQHIKECLASIRDYTAYPSYEVIIVDNASAPEVVDFLKEFCTRHENFRLIASEKNLGFSAGNNLGLAAISRDSSYVVLLNNDVVVTRGWLSRLLYHLDDPGVGMVGPVTWPNGVANEAAIPVTYDGLEGLHAFAADHSRRYRHSSFDIPMLAMYCVALRRPVLDQIGPLDEAYGIGMFEDDDYSLRIRNAGYRILCAEDVFIHHVGRTSFGKLETAAYQSLFEKNRAYYESKWGVRWRSPRQRRQLSAVLTLPQISHHVATEYGHLTRYPKVSIVLINYNGKDHLDTCLQSLTKLDYPVDEVEVIVIDNASSDGSVAWLHEVWPSVRLISNADNVGFSKAANQGAEAAVGEYVLFLNNDMRVDPGFLKHMLEPILVDPEIGCVGAIILNWDGTAVEFAGRYFDAFSLAYEPLPYRIEYENITDTYSLFASGGGMLVARELFLGSGGFDPRYFMYHEDVDFCWRLWILGYRCYIAPRATVFHRGGASSKKLAPKLPIGWGQKHLIWTFLKNLEDDSLREALPLLIYFLAQRGLWDPVSIEAFVDIFEEMEAGLSSILHDRHKIQKLRRRKDADIFALVGHPLEFLLRSPLFSHMQREICRRVDLSTLSFDDPASVGGMMQNILVAATAVRDENRDMWQRNAKWREYQREEWARRLVVPTDISVSSPTRERSDVLITGWGPSVGVAGQPFNLQPNGKSSLWVTGEAIDLYTMIDIDGIKIPTVGTTTLLSCTIPKALAMRFSRVGRYPVKLLHADGTSHVDLGYLVIEAGST